ncbi:MAG: type VI secretion system baseplate subunit TssG [Alphaproteobacteria bacterium]|jgi:type VI secretion system protein ImpH|nr:type VI secretion system baseplate subunit TssG [Alphaproteobacteria bacterium]MBT5390656.1 type VI secretion system baseplate subunit TssG [Alphaproteobacteria bacterium]MBT5540979.1 type VI secretion system baseplate subunit TssG [Alphaproteobacteria bacterium]MBT5654072.1 type VI secretion system baseplate subunit TssG [Alphaproteobacteria bacterium]
MARTRGRKSPSVKEDLYAEPYNFDFDQAIKLLDRLNVDNIALGKGSDPAKESVRIKSRVSFAFPASDLYSMTSGDDDALPELHINFFGISGLQGPLPTPYTEQVIDRMRQRDYGFRDFLDVFNHRLVSLLYRIHKKYRIGIAELTPEETDIGKTLRAFAGIGYDIPALKNRTSVPDRSLLGYASFFWKEAHSGGELKLILSSYFGTQVEVINCQGVWIKVPKSQYTRIGTSGQFQKLGQNAVLGKRFWDQQTHFTVKIGPLPFKKFVTFLKGGVAYQQSNDLVNLFIGQEKTFDYNLVVQAEEVPETRLGQDSLLGWTTWLKTKPFEKDDAQVWINPD